MRSLSVLMPLVIFALLLSSEAACLGQNAHGLAMLGGKLSSAEKATLEEAVTNNPSDVEARTKLLGFYFTQGRQDPEVTSAKTRHIEWLIEHAPESEVLGLPYSQLNLVLEPAGYAQCKQAWLTALQKSPENLAAIANAAQFFLLHDRKLAEELLLKGQELDAANPKWPASLGQLYSLGQMSLATEPQLTVAAKKAFHQYQLAYDRSDPLQRDGLLSNLAKTALDAGLIDDATKFAETMLQDDAAGWNRGNRIHHGNLILGRIALSQGDVAEAKSRLLLAGKTPGSPQLNSFGPNMLLAKELLERGESDVVLEYFALCQAFWTMPGRPLEQWTKDVKAGRIPQFGGNLSY